MQRDGGDYLDGSRVNFSRSRDHRPPRVGVWFGPVETSGSPLLLPGPLLGLVALSPLWRRP